MTYQEIKAMQDREREVAQWYSVGLSEQDRQQFVTPKYRAYGLTPSFHLLPTVIRENITAEYNKRIAI